MKRIIIFPGLLLAAILVQCSKDKNDNPINLTKGLLAVFKMNNEFEDSTGNIPVTAYSSTGIKAVADRKGNAKSAMYFDEGEMSATVDGWSANPITVSCWVLPKNNTNNNFFLVGGGTAFGFAQSKAFVGFVVTIPAINSAMASLDTGWVHVVGTYDGKDIRTYINGQLSATTNHPGEPKQSNTITLGSFGTPYWKGVLDEVRFYNRILRKEEIALLAKL